MKPRSWTAAVLLLGILAAGAVVNRAALHATLDLDDFEQRAMIEGTLTPRRGPFNLYDLIADDNRAMLLDRGVIRWWSDPHLAIRFLRPLPSLLVWVDHKLFGWDAYGPHVLSFLWWVGAALGAHLLYRRVAENRAAWIATAVFALSPSLSIPLVWLANRSILVSLAFGAVALALYVRWRTDQSRPLGVATIGAFGAAALTGEYALCMISYVIAFELCQRAEPVRRRLIGMLPAAGPLLLYALTRAGLRYGTVGTGFYRDPTTETGTYLRALPRTFSALFASAWLGADVTAPWLSSQFLQAILILGATALVVGTVWSARREPSTLTPGAGWWLACGSVLALLPLAATEPSRRLLGVAALGVSGAVGVLLAKGARSIRRPVRLPLVLGLAAVVGLIHLVIAPFQTRRLSFDAVEEQVQNLARFETVPGRARSVDTALVLRANYGLTVLSAPFILREQAPKHWLVLSHTFEQTAAIRTSPSSIEVVQEDAPLFPLGPTGIVRTTPFNAGDVVETTAVRATVLRVDDVGRPLAVRYELNRDLDSPDVAWISEGRSGFSDVVPPPVGVGVRLAP
jgi:hypothetical protein